MNNQLARWPSHVHVRKWQALVANLGLVQPNAKNLEMLVRMHQYIATTPPELRCPCTRGIVLSTIGEHFPELDAVSGLELKEKQMAEVDYENIQFELKRQRIEQKWA